MTPSKGTSFLIVGGARSGKSAYAEALCEESQSRLIYVATSPRLSGDAELEERIRLHRERRGPRWQLVEEQTELARIIKQNAAPDTVIMIDCMTLWLNNLVYYDLPVDAHAQALLSALREADGQVVLISNEVGQGVVPANAETRAFRDQQGWLNQTLARHCDTVVEVRLGLPILLKPSSHPAISLSASR